MKNERKREKRGRKRRRRRRSSSGGRQRKRRRRQRSTSSRQPQVPVPSLHLNPIELINNTVNALQALIQASGQREKVCRGILEVAAKFQYHYTEPVVDFLRGCYWKPRARAFRNWDLIERTFVGGHYQWALNGALITKQHLAASQCMDLNSFTISEFSIEDLSEALNLKINGRDNRESFSRDMVAQTTKKKRTNTTILSYIFRHYKFRRSTVMS